MTSPRHLSPQDARLRFREGALAGPTTGFAPGYLQANLVILPAVAADAFEDYCARNPRPCPLLERLAPGDPEPRHTAPGADIRRDLPRYRRYLRGGALEEITEISSLWTEDAVGFLLGCSFSFEEALARAGLKPRHQEQGRNVSMYRTNRVTAPAGPFAGPLVVSMRPMPADRVGEVYDITARFVLAHGAPVYHGDPAGLGIADLDRPEWGEACTIHSGEVPVFWACGVTSQVAVTHALEQGAISWAIGHAPGHMFITDLRAEESGRG